jgi:ABC-type phosphate/phosphonate transport system substrate-binding protein
MRSTIRLLPKLLLLALASLPSALVAGDDPLRIGIPDTFYHDMSPALIRQVTDPFADVLRETTGLKGEPVTGGTPMAVAAKLHDGKLQMAVLHAFEFAWARAKYADLEPMMLAARTTKDYRACVLVRKEGGPASFADLKGKELAVPKRTKEGCRRFIAELCKANGVRQPSEYFSQIVHPTDLETGLDNLARGKYPAVLVDSGGQDFYKDLKPGVFARFKVLVQSEPFAPLVVVYYKGALPDATLTRIRNGLRAAAKTETGRDMMKTWHIGSFDAVPADFAQTVAATLKRYPPPAEKD